MRENCEHLTTRQYSSAPTFIRNMYFIFLNKLYEHVRTVETIQKFSNMMDVILTKNTMREYRRVYDDPTVEFELPVVIAQ